MANVKKYTDQIAKAQKGRDVRDAIVNAINAVSDENNEYNQVKTDILEAQADIAEKVAKNEHTEQTFAADVKKAEALKQGLDSNIEQGTALKGQLDTAVSTANTAKKNLDSTNTTAAQRKTDLDGSINTAQTLKGNLESDISQGTTLKQGLDSDITQGTALKSQLETTISTADTGKKNLDASNTTAGKTKTALDASNTTAAETKADLDASNATASETKTGLDATNKTAAGLVTSLGDKIAEGTQVKTDIQTTGETAMSNLQAEATKQQEYIKTSIDDTLSVSGKAADAAVTGKKIDSLKSDLETQSSNLDYEVDSRLKQFYKYSKGATEINDSDNGRLHNLKVYGRSEQKQYSGKNLFDFHQLKPKNPNITTVTTTEDAIIVSSNAQTFTGAVKIYEKCDAFKGKTITISANIVKADNFDAIINFGCGLFYENVWHWKLQKVTDLGARYITVIVPETITKIQFLLNTNDTNVAKANTITVSEYMVEYGSEPTTYEPYTGGIPSPNPDYPQEIKSVVNPTMKVCGKNLLNYKETIINGPDVAGIEFVENGFRIYTKKDVNYCSSKTYLDFSKLRIGETYTLSANLLIVKGVSRLTIRNRVNTIIADSSNITESGTYKISFTLTDQMYYVSFFATFDAAVSGDVIVTDIQLEKNATPTAFEPYHEQTVTLPYTLNAIPVNSGGNVTIDGQQYIADYVDVERGKLVRMVEKKVLNGTENWNLSERSENRNGVFQFFADANIAGALCDKAIYESLTSHYGTFDTWYNQIRFYAHTDEMTVEEWRNFLSSNNHVIYIVRNTPVKTDLTKEEITAFKALTTYYPTTNIFINSEQLDGYTVFNYPTPFEDEWIKTKKDVDSLKEDISNKITKFYASSQGETHLADSDNGKIMDMMLYGKSEQKQYSGKNLLNATLQTTTVNGVTCTANGDGTYTINGTATSDTLFHIGYFIFEKDTKYKIVGCPQGGSLNTLYRLDGSLNANSDTGNGIVYSGDGNKRNARIVVFNGATVNNLLFKPMITTDLTATYDDFEPYTGGIPSPNPDYPQEIKSVVNPTVKVCGKNLYPDGDLIELTKSYTTDFIPVVFNRNTIYLAFECNTNTVDGKYYINMIYYDKNKQKLGSNGSASQIGEKITKIEDSSSFNGIGAGNGGTNVDLKKVSYVKIVFNIYDNTATKITYKNIVVSSTPTAYEPYHEQTVTLPYTLNAIPVESGGNVTINGQQYIADYVDVERGKRIKMVGEVDLGSLDWTYMTRYTAFAANVSGKADGQNMLCSMYINYGTANLSSMPDMYICANSRGEQFFIKNSKYTDADAFKQAMSGAMLYYELATPEEIDLTTEEIKAFELLQTYYPTTNISVNSEQLDGYTVFNYPISMENGWNYVKQQIGDTREYIYDIDARTQDTDLQAAEAYVNSEYAVALTELEV